MEEEDEEEESEDEEEEEEDEEDEEVRTYARKIEGVRDGPSRTPTFARTC